MLDGLRWAAYFEIGAAVNTNRQRNVLFHPLGSGIGQFLVSNLNIYFIA